MPYEMYKFFQDLCEECRKESTNAVQEFMDSPAEVGSDEFKTLSKQADDALLMYKMALKMKILAGDKWMESRKV